MSDYSADGLSAIKDSNRRDLQTLTVQRDCVGLLQTCISALENMGVKVNTLSAPYGLGGDIVLQITLELPGCAGEPSVVDRHDRAAARGELRREPGAPPCSWVVHVDGLTYGDNWLIDDDIFLVETLMRGGKVAQVAQKLQTAKGALRDRFRLLNRYRNPTFEGQAKLLAALRKRRDRESTHDG